MKKLEYPYINKLKIPIHIEDGIPHILTEDIEKVLDKKQFNLFCKHFGIQTGLRRKDGKFGLYCWDCESVLVRIFEGELTGTQLFWD